MKKAFIALSILAVSAGLLMTGCQGAAQNAEAGQAADSTAVAGGIVYFSIDRVISGYDMANDLSAVVETKVSGIQAEIERRGNKLQKDINDFNSKMERGLLTRSVAEVQQQRLQKQQNDYQQYVIAKQQEMAEEQQVLQNQILNAISEYVKTYNEEKGYAMILASSGDILSAPVVTGDPALDITEELLSGLNAEYIKTKDASK